MSIGDTCLILLFLWDLPRLLFLWIVVLAAANQTRKIVYINHQVKYPEVWAKPVTNDDHDKPLWERFKTDQRAHEIDPDLAAPLLIDSTIEFEFSHYEWMKLGHKIGEVHWQIFKKSLTRERDKGIASFARKIKLQYFKAIIHFYCYG